ncbi:MAG: sucrose-6-phosphate hydrolase [Candidatus Epulonipiscioides saccharophilum]|nr:MAG: sucrose-6-phosphate hydrolase [Epulopiscium sp. AS2M-Bin001]
MKESNIYLDTYVLQQDMRIRLPKSILSNLQIEKGKTKFDVFLDSENKSLVLKIHSKDGGIIGE